MASIARRSGTRGLWQPRGWGFRGGSSGSMRSHSSSGSRQPSSGTRADAFGVFGGVCSMETLLARRFALIFMEIVPIFCLLR